MLQHRDDPKDPEMEEYLNALHENVIKTYMLWEKSGNLQDWERHEQAYRERFRVSGYDPGRVYDGLPLPV